jgi:hypothetical protein
MLTNSFGNKKYMQAMGRRKHALKCLDFFLSFKFWVEGVGGKDFLKFIFPLFPLCSLQVPNGFLSSQCVPQGCSK